MSPRKPASSTPRKTRAPSAQTVLRPFHPLVRAWFTETLGAPSPPQLAGWPAIATGEHTLILAPTGTGKTLAAFLWELNALIAEGERAPLANAVHLLYISPLKALNNDIQRNLETPLAALRLRFEEEGRRFPEIRVAVRTGDTPTAQRARMIRRSPHILITTPESLHILLTSERARTMFSATRAVIVDEIHAVAGTKRGAHLALTLERLDALRVQLAAEGGGPTSTMQRIGLSATQRPLDEIARFLGGMSDSGEPRPVTVVECGLVKKMETSIVSPVPDIGHVGGTVWPAVAALALDHVKRARTTLIFVNNRAQAERIAARINALAEVPLAQPYHGSLARERRFELEKALKAGQLRALVATSSLELGIDIGSVDLVMQLQSPKRVAAALQRVGRAGHTIGATSRGIFVPTFRDDAMEIAAIVAAMRDGEVEATRVVQNALDVLSQVIVASASVDEWTADALFVLTRRAYPYHALSRDAFDEVLSMLAGKYPSDLASELEARVTWDRTTGTVTAGRGARITAVISGGTIPDRGLYSVVLPDRTRLGELDEEFVHESRIGDVFQLGSSTWRIGAIEHDRVIVQPAPGAPARMPFWHGEFMSRPAPLAARVGALRRALSDARTLEQIAAIAQAHGSDESTMTALAEYCAAQRAATGAVPDDRTVLVEQFRDETGSVRVVVHSVFGGRVNAPWGMALGRRMREMLGEDVDVQVQTTDDGIMLRMPDLGRVPPVAELLRMTPEEAEERVVREIENTPVFGARFRMNAARALLLPRGSARRRMPLWLQRLKAADLLQVVREFPRFPILVETYRDVLQDGFDIVALRDVLTAISDGRIVVRSAETDLPSPFSQGLQFGFVMDWMYGDDTPRAERAAAMLALDRGMLGDLMGEAREAGDETLVAMEALLAERRGTAEGRRARTADELAAMLDRAGDLTREELEARVASADEGRRGDPLRELLSRGRVVGIRIAGDTRFILTESFGRYGAVFGTIPTVLTMGDGAEDALVERPVESVVPDPLRAAVMTPGAARREVLLRWLALAGPVTAAEVHARYGWPERWVTRRLEEWERNGRLVRGRFRAETMAPEWAVRRVVERARQRALAALRRQVHAVSMDRFAAFLHRWQKLDPRDRDTGPSALAGVLKQMYGVPRPGAAWERLYLPARVGRYEPAMLAHLAATGTLVWSGEGARDVASGMITLRAIRFFERGSGAVWLAPAIDSNQVTDDARRVLDALERTGASFLADLQMTSGLSGLALREALRELVAIGLVTNDSIEAMRHVVRARPLPPKPGGATPDPARWLPANFSPTPGRPVVQRRPNIRRLPRWRPPDEAGGSHAVWPGRWTLLRTPGTLGPEITQEARAAVVAQQWLSRYGVVSRDWWKRERPPAHWRDIYQELKRMEYRGEVRRGYFVKGLAGAQFALPEAVERLRADEETNAPLIVIAATDPANVHAIKPSGVRDHEESASAQASPLTRPRGAGALLIVRDGVPIVSVEGQGRRVHVSPTLSEEEITAAANAMVHFQRETSSASRKAREIAIRTIDGRPAGLSPHAEAFRAAGFRRFGSELRYLDTPGSPGVPRR